MIAGLPTGPQPLSPSTPWPPIEPHPPPVLQADPPLAVSLASSPLPSPGPPLYSAARQPLPPSWPSLPQAPHSREFRWTTAKSPGDYQENGPKKERTKRPRTKSVVEGGIPNVSGVVESPLEGDLLLWFMKASIRQLFQRGSPLVLPSKMQRKWEQLVLNGGSQELNVPPRIQEKVSSFLKLLRASY